MNQRAKVDIRHSTCPHDCPSACALDIEVIPTGLGSSDITSLVADRIVREVITGVALKRSSDAP